jgi:hypothetical protein
MSEADFEDELIGAEGLSIGPVQSGYSKHPEGGRSRERNRAQLVNVLEWSEKWNYQPGTQYVKLFRAYPKKWSNIPIGGDLEDIYEPFDAGYIKERWGGGTYMVHAIQLDPDGRTRTADRKEIALSGVPFAFPGPDGEPTPLPQPKGVDPMRYKEEEEFDDGHDRNGTPSAVDLYYAAQANANQNRSADPETLEVLRNAQNDANEHMKSTMEAQSRLTQQTIENQERELSRMRETARDREGAAAQPFNYAMQMMETRSQAETTNLRAQLDAIRGDHTMQVQMVQNEHSRVTESYTREMDRLREDARIREETVRSSVTGQYQAQITALENRAMMAETHAHRQVEIARQDADRRESNMKMMLEHSYDGRMQLLLAEKGRLENDLASTKRELGEYRAVAMEVKDPITQLTQMQHLVSAVQGFGGGQAEESAPEDFLGKVAHYGPTVAKNFLTPILQRVDAATHIANRSVETREAELAAVASMRARDEVYTQPTPRRIEHSHNQPPAHNQPDPLHTPGPGEGIIPDGMRQLVEFLDEKITSDSSAENAANELIMGIQMGVVPPEVFNEFVNRPDDEVLQDISAASSVMHKPTLSSPRGINFTKGVLSSVIQIATQKQNEVAPNE